jgi:tetratricopeptide (TPR) repeat protein
MPITTSSDQALEYYIQGRTLNEGLRVPEAREYYQKAVDEDPDFALAHLQLAGVQTSAKAFFENFNKAKALADRVSEAERTWIQAFEAAAIEGDPLKARKLYAGLVAQYPNDERAHNLLATSFFGQQEWQEAIAEYEKAIAINADFAPVYNQLGYSYRFLGQYDRAEKIFARYVELVPDDPNPYDSYAELLMKMGRFDESIVQYKKALEIDPDFAFSHAGIATNLNFKGEHDAARAQLQQMYDAAADDGQRRTALTAMAWSYMDEGEFDQAVATFEKQYAIALQLADTSAMAADLVLMGYTVIEVSGREKEALSLFERAAAMVQGSSLSDKVKDQNRHASHFNLGRAYVAMGDTENARKYATMYREKEMAVNHATQLKQAHQLDGLIALQDGQFDVAIEELEQTNLINPYNNFFLGEAYQAKGDQSAAKKCYEEAAHCNSLNGGPQAAVRTRAGKKAAAL